MKKLGVIIVLAVIECSFIYATPKVCLFSDCLGERSKEEFKKKMEQKIEPFGAEIPELVDVYDVQGVKDVWKHLSKAETIPEIVLICCQDADTNVKTVKHISKHSDRKGYDILWFTHPSGVVSRYNMTIADFQGFNKRFPSADETSVAEYIAESTAQWWTGIAKNNPSVRRITLWDGMPPQYEFVKDEMINSIGRIDYISVPELEIFLPTQEKESPALIFLPGGGLSYTGFIRNARELATILNPYGIAVIGVKYRVKRGEDIAFKDVTRAIRLVRHLGSELNIKADAIGIGGQSAGALLTLHLTSVFDDGAPLSTDPVEHNSSRPDFSVILTSWNMGQMTTTFKFGEQTPPVFLRHAKNDSGFELAKNIVKQMELSGVEIDYHFVEDGGHGAFEIDNRYGGHGWPDEFAEWLSNLGMITYSL